MHEELGRDRLDQAAHSCSLEWLVAIDCRDVTIPLLKGQCPHLLLLRLNHAPLHEIARK